MFRIESQLLEIALKQILRDASHLPGWCGPG
jgi:hypothetical protein